ncbi:hypothetical protein [Pseudorhodoferax sp. Leaf265]|jgi:hypothetical protein|uniref:hypothetical protein n=1 Tax=Pseudorhodoferax sp. Leaf265 TaxID=1736315 RepID=UPI0007003722|nr:hypothetical protein [Pseudorhodoferax sp. Leaf265]KQP16178.1 hypothetical protein ASF45_06430 [Pseudorhodoferax sp. Leaf265]PZQ00307.1 MAG: hypothetical protein DI583_08555 [Variovorax paradoxus]PZQ12729.1 MAG: hypothetical protein DI587_08555 [Variovorax paradoxus]
MDNASAEIAAVAARLVVDDGLEWGAAKRRAVQQLGLGSRARLPGNDELEDAVREHIAIFCADTQPRELAALRRLALTWMERLESFRPYLAGAVWHGTATRRSDIYLQLFCDDPKSAEIMLIDRGVRYAPSTVPGFRGDPVEALSLQSRCSDLDETIGVHLLVHDLGELRGALKPDARGRTPRGSLEAVRKLVAQEATA